MVRSKWSREGDSVIDAAVSRRQTSNELYIQSKETFMTDIKRSLVAKAFDMQKMPFTAKLLTMDELKEWVASRRAAGRAINVETCEVKFWPSNFTDPYDINAYKAQDVRQIHYFVRDGESCGWIHLDELPHEKIKALKARLVTQPCGRPEGTAWEDDLPF